MAQEAAEEVGSRPRGRKRRWLRNGFRILGFLLPLVLVIAWFQRVDIADSVIADTFASNNVRASYAIDSIGPRQQLLSDIVIGDPERPDLTIERLELTISPRLGLPELTRLRVVNPRLYGTVRDGSVSFGDLDPLIFTGQDGPIEFPNMELVIEDGRGLLETDYGRVGLKLDGGGHLRGGFAAEFAAVSDELVAGGCALAAPTLFGRVSIDAERPHFVGPLRFAQFDCEQSGVGLQDGAVQLDLLADRNLADFEAQYGVHVGRSQFAGATTDGLGGEGRLTWRDGTLNALYNLAATDVTTSAARASQLAIDGRARAFDRFERFEVEGEITGSAITPSAHLDGLMAESVRIAEGSLVSPLLAKLHRGLARELADSTLAASFDARVMGERASLVLPEARLRGASGATVLALSRVQLNLGEDGVPRFSGNLVTGGADLPQISGRMEQAGDGGLELRLTMRAFVAGESRLEVPRMTVLQRRDGRLAFEGEVQASGPFPSGLAQGLRVPVDGIFGTDGSLTLGNGCRDIAFDRLSISGLTLRRQSLTLCPPAGRPILRYDDSGLQLAAGTASLDLRGELSDTPVRLRSGALDFAYPGMMAVSDVDVSLGTAESTQRFAIGDLRVDLSTDSIAGEFSGADIHLAQLPQDFVAASGTWRYTGSILALEDVGFTLRYRGEDAMFEPLVARGASLTLEDNVVRATALMRHPVSDREITRVVASHDLSSSTGHADLFFDGIVFDDQLQPSPLPGYCQPVPGTRRVPQTGLSCLALGVVSLVEGTVTGYGRIEWDENGVTSRGEFSSTSLDLAAAFGPVQGASGTIVFTDLLGLTTAPDQRISLAAINPGIEVYQGEVGFQLIDGQMLRVNGGRWPFMGGTLIMRPVDINIGVEEFRTYVMEIEGLQASQFIERMEMGNIAASGTFDGVIPIVFDPDGNGQLVEGQLVSRAPGGHLSYVGDLVYEDMGFIANYAFRSLRDLQYNRMEVDMNGPLTGELVTQVRFDGIRQGETAERNFITRAIDKLPIELRINIRASFYELLNDMRSLYDPAFIKDPRTVPLVDDEGRPVNELLDEQGESERNRLQPVNSGEPDIQPPESEALQ